MFGQTNLSGRNLSNMFERSFPDKLSVVCRLYIGVVSVLSGAFGDVSVLIWPPMVDSLSVLDRLCVGHMSADLTPIQGQFDTESSPT